MNIVFLTGNRNKLDQLRKYTTFPFDHQDIDLPEIQSLNSQEVIEHKTREAYQRIGKPVLVEDISLRFTALGNLPGPFIKWFLQELGTSGLCRLAHTLANTQAHAEVTYGLFDGENLHLFQADLNGTIAIEPKGENGFGWDPIFIPEGWNKTLAEMNEAERATVSLRRRALALLEEHLKHHT